MPTDLLTEVETFRDDVFRNIVGIRESQDLYDDLTDDYALAQAIESETKPCPSRLFIPTMFSSGSANIFMMQAANTL